MGLSVCLSLSVSLTFCFSFPFFYLGGRRGPCFLSCHLISFFFFFFEGRPISTVVLHPAGSQVCFFGRIRRKGGGGTKSSLNSLVFTCINSIPCFCWSVSSELLF